MNDANLWIFADFWTTAKAFLVFTFFMTAPGYVAGWLSDSLGFRRGSALRQAALAVPLSISVTPILIYLPWRFISVDAACVVMVLVGAAFAVILTMEIHGALSRPDAFRSQWQAPRRAAWITGIVAIAIWLAIAFGSLLDLRMGKRLYFSVTSFDYLSRVPITNALAHQEKLPAITPFLTLPQPVQLRYHYFWPLVCGLTEVAGRGSFEAREATVAGALWSGIALLCLIAVYLRVFQGVESARWRTYALGLSLVGVTGLDILPVLFFDLQHLHAPVMFYATIEWWNEQITGWLDAMLWVPHHVGSLIACLTAFLVLWHNSQAAAESESKHHSIAAVAMAACALASAAGMSIHVTIVGAAILVVWSVVVVIRRGFRDLANIDRESWMPLATVAAAGVLSLLIALPFLLELSSATQESSGIHFQVRRFTFLADYLKSLGLGGNEQSMESRFFRLLFLPLNYFLELGVYSMAGAIVCRRLWKSRPLSNRDLAAVAVLGASAFVCTFFASTSGTSGNDLGWRGFMPAQFILLLWTTELLNSSAAPPAAFVPLRRGQFRVLILLLAIGVSSTMADLVLLRTHDLFVDSPWFNELSRIPNVDHRVGEHYAVVADTYAWIRSHTPANAVVQANPDERAFFYGLYANRPALAIGADCDGYSGRTTDCVVIKSALRPLFSGHESRRDFPDVCRAYPVDLLIVTAGDPVWREPDSWIRYYRPVYSSEFTRVFACRKLPGLPD
jgi:hypothetical protein